MRVNPKFLIKLAASIALFALALRNVDIGAVRQTVARAEVLPMALALLLSLAMAFTDAAQWRSVLGSLGHRISLVSALAYSFSGSFFAVLAPSSMGADIFRAAQLRRLGVQTEVAIRAVVSSRLVAFVSLLMVIASGLPITSNFNLTPTDQFILGATFLVGLCSLAGILLLDPIYRRLPILRRYAVFEKVAAISHDLAIVISDGRHARASLTYATATHVLRLSTFVALAWAFHASIGFWQLYALVPISLLIAMVPITIGSWGVREISVVYFLGWAGVGAAAALSMSVVFGLLRLVVAAIGGIVWVFVGSHHYSLQIAGNSD